MGGLSLKLARRSNNLLVEDSSLGTTQSESEDSLSETRPLLETSDDSDHSLEDRFTGDPVLNRIILGGRKRNKRNKRTKGKWFLAWIRLSLAWQKLNTKFSFLTFTLQ